VGLFDLSGQAALVTGATQGLGLAIAGALAEQGVITGHNLVVDGGTTISDGS
jgi:NAD(P)-dependent dehydrogenase (short-subunit alcohol dehydrogenase family)